MCDVGLLSCVESCSCVDVSLLEDGIVSFLVLVDFDGVDDCALVSVEDDCCCDVSGWVFILCRIAGGFDVSVVDVSLVCISFI